MCGTEGVYFATFDGGYDGGIMVTASHNPPDYNGMKFVRQDARPISADTGLKDIQAQLGTGDFWRLRLGIGHPGDRNEVAAYVLRKPPSAERELIEKNVDDSLKALDLLLAGEMDKAMIKIHAKPPRPKPPRPPQLNPLLQGLMNKVPAATPSPASIASPSGLPQTVSCRPRSITSAASIAS